MKTILKSIFALSVLLMLAFVSINKAEGQTTMSILPVNTSSVNSQVLDAKQWQNISLQLQDQFITQLAGLGTISKLSRDILLLLKEMTPPDPRAFRRGL
ncbi:MAG: hypothetical protein IPH45_20800 [Bacteroidales bacterium]|nr:hypothetical protein [Bacteroidales bacterium]